MHDIGRWDLSYSETIPATAYDDYEDTEEICEPHHEWRCSTCAWCEYCLTLTQSAANDDYGYICDACYQQQQEHQQQQDEPYGSN